jgi:glycosyltransferase involved in cell wall biosynthesis
MKKTISVITPCYNEESSVLRCHQAVLRVFSDSLPNYDLEHIFCDNASSDSTVSILKQIAVNDRRVKIIINSRNFGILKNAFNGALNATGNAVILFMPVDLQDPPELIPEFVKKWESGYQLVYGIRATREENFLLALTRKAFYRLLSFFSYVDYPPDAGDFQLVDKCILDVIKLVDDAQPFMRLLTFDCGYKSIGIPYTWRARLEGVSRNNLRSMVDQALNGLISFSTAPLRMSMLLGLIVSFGSLFYSFVVILLVLLGLISVQAGTPTLIIAIFFFSGVQLFFLGVLGEYVSAIYNQVRKKPLVVVRERVNFD